MALTAPQLEIEHRSFTVEEFLQMAKAGILGEDERGELIEGEIIKMTPIGEEHSWDLIWLDGEFRRQLQDKYPVSVQGPLRVGSRTQLQPDLMVLRPRPKGKRSIPTPADVLLMIEVADTSLRFDKQIKVPLYAKNGIPEVCIVDVDARAITVYLDPLEDRYSNVTEHKIGETISPRFLPEFSLEISRVLDPEAE